MPDIKNLVKADGATVFRRAFIKRKLESTGLFESDWLEITKDVKRWGKLKVATDASRPTRFKFYNVRLMMANDIGRYNPNSDENSLWNGFADQQRTLVKIESGFLHQTLGSDGIWTNTELPTNPSSFIGVIQGDMPANSTNTINLNVKPLTQVFRDFPARLLTGFTSTGMTASEFMQILWDETAGSGNYIFRPFFGDTLSNWLILTTTVNYPLLNTSTAKDVRDKTVWQVMELLAEAENAVPIVDRFGRFNFKSREVNTASTQWEFYGAGTFNREYGHTIKKIHSYGPKMSRYYSRVEVQWKTDDTVTSYETVEATLTVSGTNAPWNLGYRTYSLRNVWIQTSTVANSIATAIFNDFSSLKNEMEFSTTFIPHLDVLDQISLTIDTSEANLKSRWDLNNWAYDSENEVTGTTTAQEITPQFSGGGEFQSPNLNYAWAASYTPSVDELLLSFAIASRKNETTTAQLTGFLKCHLEGDDGTGKPDGNTLAAALNTVTVGAMQIAKITATADMPTFQFDNYQLTAGTKIHAVIRQNIGYTSTSRVFTQYRGKAASASSTDLNWSTNAGGSWSDPLGGTQGWSHNFTTGQFVDDSDALIWDDSGGDAIKLDGAIHKSLSIELDLDKLETKVISREE